MAFFLVLAFSYTFCSKSDYFNNIVELSLGHNGADPLFIPLNDDFTIRINNKEDSVIVSSDLLFLKENIQKLKECMPALMYEKITPDTIIFTGQNSGVKYNPVNTDISLGGYVSFGSSIQSFKDSVEKNQSFLIVNLYSKKIYDKILDIEQKSIVRSTYQKSKNKYSGVYYSNGKKLILNARADAYASDYEYFAELSEAYLGENNFFPFDYEELKRHDKDGFALMEDIWGEIEPEHNIHGITIPPESLKQWQNYQPYSLDSYYRKYIDAEGMPIVASRFVSDSALIRAKDIIITMLERIPKAQEYMLKANFRVGIIGYRENVTDMPECRLMPIWWPETDWDGRGRGYGAIHVLPLMTCGEENIIKIPYIDERYPKESIMVHEFAHNIEYGLRKYHTSFCNALDAAFANAKTKGLWKDVAGNDTYSATNVSEYFAVGIQAWFNTSRMTVNMKGKNIVLKYRHQLKDYDPVLYKALEMIMPDKNLKGYHFDYE